VFYFTKRTRNSDAEPTSLMCIYKHYASNDLELNLCMRDKPELNSLPSGRYMTCGEKMAHVGE